MAENISKEIFPDYYSDFLCIGSECKHNCCIGWEIDIDEKTIELYKITTGNLGEKLKKSIDFENETPYFILKNERCPFLNKNNLCEIILEKGEDYLCDICRLHPRFKNFYENVTETGIGLSCEEACRIVLSKKEKTKLLYDEKILNLLTDEEKEFFFLRNEIFEILQSKEISFIEKTEKILSKNSVELKKIPFSFWKNFFITLECFDKSWSEKLKNAKCFSFDEILKFINNFENIFEKLTVYFIFRHLQKSLDDMMFEERLSFCFLCSFMIAFISINEKNPCESDILKNARMFSNEIEYSEENTLAVIEKLI